MLEVVRFGRGLFNLVDGIFVSQVVRLYLRCYMCLVFMCFIQI